MPTPGETPAFKEFLDDDVYTAKRVTMYERVFGHTFISTGGRESTDKFLKQLQLKPGDRVLDIGCGIGGSAFMMDLEYGAVVRGIDLCSNMLEVAHQRQKDLGSKNTTFALEDILKADYEENTFDLVYSRDAIIHIEEKEYLYSKIFKWLKPGGRLFITDYTRFEKTTPRFEEIIDMYHYRFVPLEQHQEYLKRCGYEEIRVTDESPLFLKTLRSELALLISMKEDFIKEFGQDGYEYSLGFWSERLNRAETGLQGWASIYGRKPL